LFLIHPETSRPRAATPADLPAEESTQLDVENNLHTARAHGLTISSSVLAQATRLGPSWPLGLEERTADGYGRPELVNAAAADRGRIDGDSGYVQPVTRLTGW
jgi:hypothetical protein